MQTNRLAKSSPKPARLLLLAGVSAFLVSCAGSSPEGNARPFPTDLRRGEVLDIQVVRSETRISLTNTSARSFGACSLWLNRRFVMPLDGFAVGETLRLNLRDFRDEFGQPYRAGGFFAAEPPERIVLAEIEAPNAEGKSELLALVVVGGGL